VKKAPPGGAPCVVDSDAVPDVILFYPKLRPVEEAILLPVSVTTVAAPMVEAGLTVEIIDQRVEPDWQGGLRRSLARGAAFVGFSCMTGGQIHYALQAAALVGEVAPDVPRVWGGVHPTLFPAQTLADPRVDLVVVGEGDHAGRDLALALREGREPTEVPGVFRLEGEELLGHPRQGYHDLDTLPDVPYQLLGDVERYIDQGLVGGPGGRELVSFTSRGCPFRCGFCYVPAVHNRRWRGLSPELVIERFQHAVERFGVTAFGLQDDYFFANPGRARRICEGILDAGLQIRWLASCRVDMIGRHLDREFLQLIRESGCHVLTLGIESGSERVLRYIRKDFTLQQILEVNRLLAEVGITPKYYFMAGFPTETEEEMYETLQLMQRLRLEGGRVRIPPWRGYTPYPGSCLFDESVRHGFSPPTTLSGWGEYEFGQVRMPWVTPRLQRLIDSQPRIIRHLGVRRRQGSFPLRQLGNAYSAWLDWRVRRRRLEPAPEQHLVELALRCRRRARKGSGQGGAQEGSET
jgi:anaerobic magnesium-protoporphyrin IX monomethyl ester cyclase